MQASMTEIFTAEEVASKLKTTVRTVRGLIRAGKLKGKKVGREYRVTREDLDKFMSG